MNLLLIVASRTFPRQDIKTTGRKLLTHDFGPRLCIGVTKPDFQMLGKVPYLMLPLIIARSGSTTSNFSVLISLLEMRSGPEELLAFKLSIHLSMSSREIGDISQFGRLGNAAVR